MVEGNRSSVPSLLQGVLELIHQGNRAGEWELQLDTLSVPEGYVFQMSWVMEILRQFRDAFPWVTFHTITVGVADQEAKVWRAADGNFNTWLDAVSTGGSGCTGVEASLDITVDWLAPDDSVQQTMLPLAGELTFSLTNDVQGVITATLTIWPNLFTDEIYIYEGENWQVFKSRLIPFHAAARNNRARLAASLRDWEQQGRGQIINWTADSVETGVQKYGFSEDAQPF